MHCLGLGRLYWDNMSMSSERQRMSWWAQSPSYCSHWHSSPSWRSPSLSALVGGMVIWWLTGGDWLIFDVRREGGREEGTQCPHWLTVHLLYSPVLTQSLSQHPDRLSLRLHITGLHRLFYILGLIKRLNHGPYQIVFITFFLSGFSQLNRIPPLVSRWQKKLSLTAGRTADCRLSLTRLSWATLYFWPQLWGRQAGPFSQYSVMIYSNRPTSYKLLSVYCYQFPLIVTRKITMKFLKVLDTFYIINFNYQWVSWE